MMSASRLSFACGTRADVAAVVFRQSQQGLISFAGKSGLTRSPSCDWQKHSWSPSAAFRSRCKSTSTANRRSAVASSSRPRKRVQRGKATLSRQAVNQEESWLESAAEYFRRQRTVPIPRWVTPSHQTISLSELLGHSSFVLVAISYAVDDFLMLRCIAVVGSTAMLFFAYFHPHGRALWLPFKWNALFIALNSYRIGKVLLDRHNAENLGKDFIALRDDHFHLMDPVDFAKLIRLGKVESLNKGDILVSQGDDNRHVRLVLEGELEVRRDGKMTYLMNEANFVSESGLHTGLMLPGAVNSCCTVLARSEKARVLAWDRDELLHLMERDASMSQSLQNAMSWDIVRKLKNQRLLISSNLIEDPEQWTERRNEQTQHRYTAILHNLLQHRQLRNSKDGRVHLHNYRVIHHISDEDHEKALKACGWTSEEFEKGHKKDEHPSEHERSRSILWLLKDLHQRLFG